MYKNNSKYEIKDRNLRKTNQMSKSNRKKKTHNSLITSKKGKARFKELNRVKDKTK